MATDAVGPEVPVTRVIAGFAVQPVLAALLGYLLFPVIAAARGLQPPYFSDAALSVAAGAVIAALGTLVVAVPVFAWRISRGPISFAETLAWGGALGVAPLLLLGAASGQATPHVIIRVLLAGSVFGFAGSAVFWLISVRRTTIDSDLRARA